MSENPVLIPCCYPPQSMTLQEALKLALTVLKQVMEEKVSGSNVEVAAVTPEKGFHRYPQAQVETIISDL